MLRTVEGAAPPDELLAEIETGITEMVRQAGQMALRYFQAPLQVEFKQKNRSDPVTEADKEVEAYLRSSIMSRFPDHGILGEEGTEVDVEHRDYVWALDPIDGTTNFVNSLPLFGCSAGLLYRGTPVVGAIFVPVAPLAARHVSAGEGRPLELRSAVLHARLGGGTWLDDERVRTKEGAKPEPTTLVGLPGYHSSQFRRRGALRYSPGEPRCLGSVSYETAMVASGVFGYSVFRRAKVWDVAAGVLLVREAGGAALEWTGDRWQPMTRFEPMKPPKGNAEASLRHWNGTLLLGGTDVVQHVAGRLRPGRSWLSRMAERVAAAVDGWRLHEGRPRPSGTSTSSQNDGNGTTATAGNDAEGAGSCRQPVSGDRNEGREDG